VAAGAAAAGSEAAGAAGAAAGADAAGDAAGLASTADDGTAEPAAGDPVLDADGEADPDAEDFVGTGEIAVDAASSPVSVGAAAEVAAFTAASDTAEDRDDRVARNHTMPISTATASTTAATLRTQ
jgi:hypothetical protein